MELLKSKKAQEAGAIEGAGMKTWMKLVIFAFFAMIAIYITYKILSRLTS